MTTTKRFDEESLRADIHATWGEFGAHADLYDVILDRARQAIDMRSVLTSIIENDYVSEEDYYTACALIGRKP